MENLSLTLVQPNLVWQNREANFNKLEMLIDGAKTIGDIIVLPEMFTTGFSMTPDALYDEPLGVSLKWMQKVAELHSAAICGSVIIKEGHNYFNRLYFVLPSGEYHIYDKRHLFTLAGEEKVYTAGERQLFIEYKGWRIMPLVCYDLRFPVWCRNTTDVDLQIFVANWPERRSMPWKALLKARAIENMCFVVGLNRVGDDGNQVAHSGDSMVLDELGNELLTLTPFEEEVATVKISRSSMLQSRKRFQFLSDRDSFNFTF
jgi:predicted amidohydrolase